MSTSEYSKVFNILKYTDFYFVAVVVVIINYSNILLMINKKITD